MVSESLLHQLHRILQKDYGKNLSRNELIEISDALVNYISLLAKIDAGEELKNKESVKRFKPGKI